MSCYFDCYSLTTFQYSALEIPYPTDKENVMDSIKKENAEKVTF